MEFLTTTSEHTSEPNGFTNHEIVVAINIMRSIDVVLHQIEPFLPQDRYGNVTSPWFDFVIDEKGNRLLKMNMYLYKKEK